MLKVSKLADYGTVVMVYMAHVTERLHNARDIALHTRIALPTVSKILKLLTRQGLLISSRGVKGGYSLARSPEAITLAEILQAMDGDFGMTDCSHASSSCTLEPICSIRFNWQLISRIIFQSLQGLTLADMAKPLTNTDFYQKLSFTQRTENASRYGSDNGN